VAREIYKVAIDEETLVINHEETEKLRETERVNRKKRGVPYRDFIRQWNKKRPDEEILLHYGTWPDPA
jgi:hypothetical protein